jgi:protein O-GlcNAc transferase
MSSPPSLIERLFRERLEVLERIEKERTAATARDAAARLAVNPDDHRARVSLAKAIRREDPKQALHVLLEGMDRPRPGPGLALATIHALNSDGFHVEACELARQAHERFPERLEFRLAQLLLLPILYDSEDEIARSRQRFAAGLNELLATAAFDDAAACRLAVKGIRRWDNFLLAYQGESDVALQQQYGGWVHQIMKGAFGDVPATGGGAGKKLRVGFVSAHLFNQTVPVLFQGWVEHLDRSRFEVYSYHAGNTEDSVTDKFRELSDGFFHATKLEPLVARLREDRPDVLVYLDVGMNSPASQLAALRIAPVQCATWGHPVTTGLRTVDYFLSSELMEPEDGESHYSEKLVRLPGISVCVSPPPIVRSMVRDRRSDFGVPEDHAFFLCAQSSFKYLPEHDFIFAKIARALPKSSFVFIVPGDNLKVRFRRRLERAFRFEGLDADTHCVLLDPLYHFRYLSVNVAADVFLDSFGWSGGCTTLEAVGCGLPVVTCPGRFMRGRHSAAILRQMGVPETITGSAAEYISTAVRIGTDKEFRDDIRVRMKQGHGSLFRDTRCVRALEAFFIEAIESARYSGASFKMR